MSRATTTPEDSMNASQFRSSLYIPTHAEKFSDAYLIHFSGVRTSADPAHVTEYGIQAEVSHEGEIVATRRYVVSSDWGVDVWNVPATQEVLEVAYNALSLVHILQAGVTVADLDVADYTDSMEDANA
jgi:hypothetical protein